MLLALPTWNVPIGGAIALLGLGALFFWHGRRASWKPAVSAAVSFSSTLALVTGTVLAFSAHGHQPTSRVSPIEATQESVEAGCELFEQNCAVCHGSQGQADGPAAPVLPYRPPSYGKHLRTHGDALLFLWISQGRPPGSDRRIMPPFEERLTEEERWHVVNFLWETFGSGDPERVPGEDGDCSSLPR